MKRIILILVGWIAVGLATLGVFLPLLPTTPFLLLAVACFSRSSPRFHTWLLYRSWFSRYLLYWQQHKAMPPGVKPYAIGITLLTFAISIWWVNILWLRILLLTLLGVLLFFIWRVPVAKEKQQIE